jgi:hypothetical protein
MNRQNENEMHQDENQIDQNLKENKDVNIEYLDQGIVDESQCKKRSSPIKQSNEEEQ